MRPTSRPARAVVAVLAATVGLALPVPSEAAPTWLTPGTVLSDPTHEAADVHVAVAPGGDAIVIWREQVAGSYVVRTAQRRAGSTWEAPQDLWSGPENPSGLRVALGDTGHAVAAWVTHAANGAQQVRVTRRSPAGTWEPSENMSGDFVKGDSPQVAIGPTGRASMAYHFEAMAGGQVVAGTAEPGAADWSIEAASKFYPNMKGLHLALDGSGIPTLGWELVLSGTRRVQYNTWSPAGGWGEEDTLSDPTYSTTLADLVGTGAGGVAALTSRFNGSTYRLYSRTLTAAGWGAATPVTGETGAMGTPAMVVDGNGRGTVTFQGFNGSESDVRAMTQGADGSWSAPEVISVPGAPVMPATLARDAAGTVTAAWVAVQGGTPLLRSRSRPAGGGWGPTGEIGAAHTSLFANGSVAMDAAGNGMVAWEGKGASHTVASATALDGAGPALGAPAVPATAYAGKPVALSVPDPSDPLSPIAAVTWDFGDGTSASGTGVQHAWARGGQFLVTVHATDAVGNVTTRTAGIAVTGRPVLSKVNMSRSRLQLGGKPRTRKSRLSFVLDTSATVAVKVRKRHGSLKAALAKGGLSAGKHAFVLRTTLDGVHLKPGRYRVKLIARNPAGKGSVVVRTLLVKAAS